MRWALRKLGVDKWLIHTVMALYTNACTVAGCAFRSPTAIGMHFNGRLPDYWKSN